MDEKKPKNFFQRNKIASLSKYISQDYTHRQSCNFQTQAKKRPISQEEK